MSDYPVYDAVLQALQDGGVVVDDKYKAIGDAASTLCDVNQTVSQIPDASVVRNRDGDVIGYDYKYTGPKLPDTSIMEVDSNTDTGWYASGGGGQSGGGGAGRYNGSYYAGQVVTDPQSTDKLTGGGLVSANVSASWAITSVLSKLGKKVAEITADTLEAADLHFGVQFGPLCVDSGVGTGDVANAIRALFGVDSQGNTTMYLDEDIIGAAAIIAKDDGFFNTSYSEATDFTPKSSDWNMAGTWLATYPITIYPATPIAVRLLRNDNDTLYRDIRVTTAEYMLLPNSLDGNVGTNHTNFAIPIYVSRSPFYITYDEYSYSGQYQNTRTETFDTPRLTIDGQSYYSSAGVKENNVHYYAGYTPDYINTNNLGNYIKLVYGNNSISGGGGTLPGVSDQTGATIPVDAITGADPHVVAQNLESQYPTVMGTPVQIVVMDDSCNEVTKNYYAVPISYSPTNLNINAPITGGLQVSPSFNPDVTLDLPDIDIDNYIDQIIKILGGSGAGRDVTTEPEPDDPLTPSIDIDGGTLPVEPPDTGSGTTPTVISPTTDVTSMWHVYNPEPEGLSGLGEWLWDGSVITDIIRLFTNPMEAIMGVHAIYCVPEASSAVPIVVGNLTSTASARPVTSQYIELDCGEVWLTEYFGNVFDYEPYTSVSLYLPFIGIVPLSVADIMRAKIGVSYIIDVYTGACVARINVERDGVGGVLYEFPGDCSVKYPVSGASYTGLIQSVVSAAMSAVRVGMMTEGAPGTGALGAAVAGASFISSGQKISISHSGSFSGNHGAMGSKIPYLIISRPIPEMADNFEYYDGLPANKQISLGSCSGYTKCKEVHFTATGAYKSELDELERLLRTGIIL